MKQSIVNLLRFWSCYLKQISIKSIVFSITIATFFFLALVIWQDGQDQLMMISSQNAVLLKNYGMG